MSLAKEAVEHVARVEPLYTSPTSFEQTREEALLHEVLGLDTQHSTYPGVDDMENHLEEHDAAQQDGCRHE